jgi:hypothetical protein
MAGTPQLRFDLSDYRATRNRQEHEVTLDDHRCATIGEPENVGGW